MADYSALQNGSDVRGTAIKGENDPVTLTRETVEAIGKAFYFFLLKKLNLPRARIAIGFDSRLSSEHIAESLAWAICSVGGDAALCGLSSTPSMFMLLQEEDSPAQGSVMVTASHLPFRKNGMKFFFKSGGLGRAEVKEILLSAGEGKFQTAKEQGRLSRLPYMPQYADGLVETVRKATGEERPLSGLHIVVDAGNGAGGFYERLVLKPLGADTTGSQFLEPDGHFPNHVPNPEDAEAMRSISKAVLQNHADFGVIFDTDVDRAGAVMRDGTELNRNRLIALISAILLKEQSGAVIVTDSLTSDGLKEFIEARGGKLHRFKRGYRNVINEAIRLNNAGEYAPLAIETSGHAALKENFFLDDGAYLVTRLLIELAIAKRENRSLEDLLVGLKEPKEAQELRLPLRIEVGENFQIRAEEILSSLAEAAEGEAGVSIDKENLEGVRLLFDREHGDGWALLRMSLHEPLLPLNLESNREGGAAKMREILARLFLRIGFSCPQL